MIFLAPARDEGLVEVRHLGQFEHVPSLRPHPRQPRLGLELAAVQREEGRHVLAGLVQVDANVVDVGHVILDLKLQ